MKNLFSIFKKQSYEDRAVEAKKWVNFYVSSKKINETEGNKLYGKYLQFLRNESPLEMKEVVEYCLMVSSLKEKGTYQFWRILSQQDHTMRYLKGVSIF